MATRALITLATAWGSKHGGINSFNYDFVTALGVAFHEQFVVVCIVPRATADEIEDARRSFVVLRPLAPTPLGECLEPAHADGIVACVGDIAAEEVVWIGHDIFTGPAAVEAASRTRSKAAILNHMSYVAYKGFQSGSAVLAREKSAQQQAVFRRADWLFSVGPLLRDEMTDLLGGRKPHMILPGLPEIELSEPPRRWTMLLFGRLDPETDRIKQGRLGVAAFAKAHRDALVEAGLSSKLRDPRLKLFGVNVNDEPRLRKFAAEQAGAALDIHPLPFESDRKVLFAELAQASVAVMPSWHEGFGLVGWEAIGAGVPLVLSRRSGLYQFLDETLAGAGTGCVHVVHIRGSEDPDAPYQEQDVTAISDELKRIAADSERALRSARKLRETLLDYTWAQSTRKFVEDIGWTVASGTLPAAPASADLESAPSGLPLQHPLLVFPEPAWRAGHGHAESLLLRADEACVPFDAGKMGLADALVAWASPDPFPIMVRLHTGGGGSGKTRLLLEVCRKLGPEWKAGFLAGDCPATEIPARFTSLLQRHERIFVVVDYAETRRAELAALIDASLSSQARCVRIVLLARDAGDWWERLATDHPSCERVIAGTATSGPFPLPPLHPEMADRDTAYLTALSALAARLGIVNVAAHAQARPDLSAEHFGSPLYVQMAALLALRGERSGTANGLIDGLLRHEEHYWSRLCASHGIAGGGRAAAHLLALATLVNGLAHGREARHLYIATDGPPCEKAAFDALFRTLCELYPGRRGLQPLRPDPIGEGLVSRVLGLAGDSGPTIYNALLGSSSNEAMRRHALTVMTRLASQRPDFRAVLLEAVQSAFVPCLASIVEVSLETGAPLPSISVAAFDSLPQPIRSQASGLLSQRIPHRCMRLAELALRADGFRLSAARAGYSRKPSEATASNLADAMLKLTLRLENLGRFEDALTHASDAHALYAKLAKSQPSHEPNLARCLNYLGNLLGELGQSEEAFARASEAHTLYARLARARPDRFEPYLAATISNLSSHLIEAGQFEEALTRANEAYAIYARLAEARPERYKWNLASSHSNVSSCLTYLGQHEQALAQADAAYTIFFELAKARPDRYEPDLAGALNNLSNLLAIVGHFEDGLDRAAEAHSIFARLAEARPERYGLDLAASLDSLACRFADLGRFGEALTTATEAHAIYARWAEMRPLRHAISLLRFDLSLHLFHWHLGTAHPEQLEHWPARAQQAQLPPHRRALWAAEYAAVIAYHSHSNGVRSGIETMETVMGLIVALPLNLRHRMEEEHLIAAAYLAHHAPSPQRTAAFQAAKLRFLHSRGGRMPATVTNALKRLDCGTLADPQPT